MVNNTSFIHICQSFFQDFLSYFLNIFVPLLYRHASSLERNHEAQLESKEQACDCHCTERIRDIQAQTEGVQETRQQHAQHIFVGTEIQRISAHLLNRSPIAEEGSYIDRRNDQQQGIKKEILYM